jgi:hypothetical protein
MTGVRAALIGLLLSVASGANGQTILGVVREEGTRTPVPGAEIVLVRSAQLGRSVTTDSAGVFRLVSSGSGQHQLRVRHIGYTPFESTAIELRPGETVTVDIQVAVARIALDPLVVRARTSNARLAGFHERRLVHSFGRFLTREEIDRRSAARTSDLLRGVPGVTIVPIRATGRAGPTRYRTTMRGTMGTCEPAIYIDGMRVSQTPQVTLDELLAPSVLEGVEVYTATAGAPPQYVAQGACGVVLFWTRSGEPGGSPPWQWKRLLAGAAAVIAIVLLAR